MILIIPDVVTRGLPNFAQAKCQARPCKTPRLDALVTAPESLGSKIGHFSLTKRPNPENKILKKDRTRKALQSKGGFHTTPASKRNTSGPCHLTAGRGDL